MEGTGMEIYLIHK